MPKHKDGDKEWFKPSLYSGGTSRTDQCDGAASGDTTYYVIPRFGSHTLPEIGVTNV